MAKISAGSYDLNKWLFGGYDSDIVNVIYGGPGSGKTNFCMLAAVSQAKKGNKVIFIDTEGGFSVERVKQLANGDVDYKKVLENIILFSPSNFNEQKEAFLKLKSFLKDQISLIIVDSMTILYRLDISSLKNLDDPDVCMDEKNDKGNKEVQRINFVLAEQMKNLAEIARKNKIPVLVTNQVYRWNDEIRMVGGDILHYWGKCLIELKNDFGKRTAFLRKHRSLKEKDFPFQIVNSGIKKRGWI